MGQQADDTKMTPFDWINRLLLVVCQFIQAEMSGNHHIFTAAGKKLEPFSSSFLPAIRGE